MAMQWPCNENPVSARVRLLDGIHQVLLAHVGYGNGLPLVCIMQIDRNKILALGITHFFVPNGLKSNRTATRWSHRLSDIPPSVPSDVPVFSPGQNNSLVPISTTFIASTFVVTLCTEEVWNCPTTTYFSLLAVVSSTLACESEGCTVLISSKLLLVERQLYNLLFMLLF